jgi:NADP-dependent 3-hydroxy acid dehydrogenase YdfG
MTPSSEARVMLITGASSGIGAATARLAVEAGFRVVLAARAYEALQSLAAELGGPEKALAVPCDVTDFTQQQTLVAQTIQHFGQLDVAFVNAGFIKGSLSFIEGVPTPDEWRDMVLTNVYGAALTARLALPELIKTQGYLLFTGSVVGRVAIPGELYSATKWAITGMGQSIRQELVGTGVHVTVIEPGLVATQFWKGPPTERDYQILAANDVARAVIYVVNQPPHVDINELLIRSLGQAV